MAPDKVRRLDALASQLSEALMTAAICAQEIHTVVRTLIDNETHTELGRGANGCAHFKPEKQRPLLDESTLSWPPTKWSRETRLGTAREIVCNEPALDPGRAAFLTGAAFRVDQAA